MGVRDLARSTMMACALSAAFAATAVGTAAAGQGQQNLFEEGSVRVSVLLGSGTAFGEDYSILGAGIGYYLADNVEIGIEGESWQGRGPGISRWSPQVQYVVPFGEVVRPYAGAFYRRTFIDQYDDFNDAGVRGGALFLYGHSAYIGVGIAHERHLGCDRAVFGTCSDTYPELQIAILF